ncbi:MAG: STAS domain-containing protein [Candidatus Zixiibacteriota bacterium]|nr:MAG: STAS domain-containing protein [candidate division Zixibacteria bacterium]
MNESVVSRTDISPDTTVIDPGQQLDNNNAHEMVDAIGRAQAEGYRYVIIDMKNLQFISSSGVGSILGSVEALREAGGDIVLCNISEDIKNVFRVLDLLDFMTIAADVDQARERCAGKR